MRASDWLKLNLSFIFLICVQTQILCNRALVRYIFCRWLLTSGYFRSQPWYNHSLVSIRIPLFYISAEIKENNTQKITISMCGASIQRKVACSAWNFQENANKNDVQMEDKQGCWSQSQPYQHTFSLTWRRAM